MFCSFVLFLGCTGVLWGDLAAMVGVNENVKMQKGWFTVKTGDGIYSATKISKIIIKGQWKQT